MVQNLKTSDAQFPLCTQNTKAQRRYVTSPGLWQGQYHNQVSSFAYFCPFSWKCPLLSQRFVSTRREWILCVITIATEKKKYTWKTFFWDYQIKIFSWEVTSLMKEKKMGFSKVPVKAKRERESFLCHRPQPSRSSHSRDYVFLLIVRDPVWNWMRICYKSVELYCSERPYLSSWREKEKGK